MTPRYCIAIARTGTKTSALAIHDKLSELNAEIEKSEAEEVDIFAKGSYVKTVRPANIRAQAKAIAERESRLASAEKPAAPKAKKTAAKKTAKPAPAKAEADDSDQESGDPLAD